jgi:hypothetical protein
MKTILVLALISINFSAYAQTDADGFFVAQPEGENFRQPEPLGHTEVNQKSELRKTKVIYEGKVPEPLSGATISESVAIKTEFEYVAGASKRVKADRTVFIRTDSHDWVGLTKSQSGVALLGRIVGKGPGLVKVEYLIVDTSRDEEAVLAPPVLDALIGQKLQVNLDRGDVRATLNIHASIRRL